MAWPVADRSTTPRLLDNPWRALRSKHGALLDAELLAAVYVELTTTRQSRACRDTMAL
jgi:DNA polymerase III epsilon subunit-like protein